MLQSYSYCKSQMSSIIFAAMVLITIVALTPLFRNLPEATLGPIVIHAIWHLIDFSKLSRIYKIKRDDFRAATVTLLGVLILGILPGLLVAIFLSILLLLYRIKTPSTVVLGRVPGQDVFRSIENFPDAETYPGLLILRFDGLLFFANAPNFREQVRSFVDEDPTIKMVLIDAESITDIDATALEMLEKLNDELSGSGVDLRFARMRMQLQDFLCRNGLEKTAGSEHFYPSVRAGVRAYLVRNGTDEKLYPPTS